MGWLPYNYRKKITITSAVGAGPDYQVPLEVHKDAGADAPGKVYLGDHARDFANDIRFAGSDGVTELDAWAQSIDRHFAENGVSQPHHPVCTYPHSYYYSGKTYVVWQGTDLKPYIDCYTHSTGQWAGVVKVSDSHLTDDDHGAPAVIVDNSGYINVFFGCHNSAMKHSKSTNTEDISAWTAQTDIGTDLTYPKPLLIDSTIYLFCRGGTATHKFVEYRKSSDGPAYSVEYQIIDLWDGTYYLGYAGNPEYDSTNGRVHIGFIRTIEEAGPVYVRRHLYYAYLNLSDGHMYSMANTDLGTLISLVEADANCKIVDDDTYEINFPVLHLDSSNYPHLIYPIDTAGGWKHKYIYWTGSAWSVPVEITGSGHQHNQEDFIINSTSDIDAYLVVAGAGIRGGSIEIWNYNGSAWAKDKTILSNVAAPLKTVLATNDETYTLANPQVVANRAATGPRWGFCEVPVAGFGNYAVDDKREFLLDENDHFLSKNDAVADFWIEVKEDLGSNRDICIYYGKSGVSLSSDIIATFIKGDDGVSGNFDTDTAGDAALSHTLGEHKIVEDSADDAFAIGMAYSTWNKYATIRRVPELSGINEYHFSLPDEGTFANVIGTGVVYNAKRRFYIARYGNGSGYANEVMITYFDAGDVQRWWTGVGWNVAVTHHAASGILEYYIWDDGTTLYADVLSNGVSIFANPASIAFASVKDFSSGKCIAFTEPYTDVYFMSGWVDDYYIRKYVSPEPVVGTPGSLETRPRGGGSGGVTSAAGILLVG